MQQEFEIWLQVACTPGGVISEREQAFLQLMLLVESRYCIGQQGTVLFPETEIVRRVAEVLQAIESDEMLCGALSVLGASRTSEALRTLVEAIENPEFHNRPVVLRQIVSSIDSIGFFAGEETLGRMFEAWHVIEKLRGLIPSGSESVDDRIRSALSNIASARG